MKKKLFIILFFCSLFSNAQKIHFEYDAAGNQMSRTWCTSCSSKNTNEPVKDVTELEDSDLQKFFPKDIISYYPNPVKEQLYLKWDLINDNKVLTIDIFSMNGQLIKKLADKLENNTSSISFKEYPVGIYFVTLNYANGDRKTIKIIKE